MSSTDPSDTYQHGSSSGNGPVPSFNETNLEQWKRDLFVYLTFYEAEAGLYEPSPDLSDDELWEHSKKSKKAFSVMARSAKPNAETNSVCDAYVKTVSKDVGHPVHVAYLHNLTNIFVTQLRINAKPLIGLSRT